MSQDTHTISVVIPAFNAARWIAETLDSVLRQTYPPFEIIVVNDGSTDGTRSIVDTYENVTCINKPNGGSGSARNVGIRMARGEYVAFLDADDLWLPDKLMNQVALLKQGDYQWVYCDGYSFNDNSRQIISQNSRETKLFDGMILRQLFLHNFILSPSPVIRRCLFEEVGYFDEKMHYSEDWEMWLRIAARYPIGLVNMPLVHYRLHDSNKSDDKHIESILGYNINIIEKVSLLYPKYLNDIKNHVLSNVYKNAGKILARIGNFQQARLVFKKSIVFYPFAFNAYLLLISSYMGKNFLAHSIKFRNWFKQKCVKEQNIPSHMRMHNE